MPHLLSAFDPSRTAVVDFQVPSGQKIAEVKAEIPLVAMLKMSPLHLVDILEGGVSNINQLPINKVVEEVPIGLPPVLGCLCWHCWKWG